MHFIDERSELVERRRSLRFIEFPTSPIFLDGVILYVSKTRTGDNCGFNQKR